MEPKRSPTQNAFRFLDLPTELRLMIYEFLPETKWLTKTSAGGYLSLLDTACDMSILRVCRLIYPEALHSILKTMEIANSTPPYHFVAKGYSYIGDYLDIMRITHKDAHRWSQPGLKPIDRAFLRCGNRMRHRQAPGSKHTFRIDYHLDPLPNYCDWSHDSYMNMLYLAIDLAIFEGCEQAGVIVNVISRGATMPLQEYLQTITELRFVEIKQELTGDLRVYTTFVVRRLTEGKYRPGVF